METLLPWIAFAAVLIILIWTATGGTQKPEGNEWTPKDSEAPIYSEGDPCPRCGKEKLRLARVDTVLDFHTGRTFPVDEVTCPRCGLIAKQTFE